MERRGQYIIARNHQPCLVPLVDIFNWEKCVSNKIYNINRAVCSTTLYREEKYKQKRGHGSTLQYVIVVFYNLARGVIRDTLWLSTAAATRTISCMISAAGLMSYNGRQVNIYINSIT